MYCVTIKDKQVSNYENIYQILKLKVDSIFVIDYDAITHRYLNLKLYDELAKFFELIVMNYPETENKREYKTKTKTRTCDGKIYFNYC